MEGKEGIDTLTLNIAVQNTNASIQIFQVYFK